MIWKNIVNSSAIAAAFAHRCGVPGLARKTLEALSDLTGVVQNLVLDVRDSYRPEVHYMRGPGPKWHAKHRPSPSFKGARGFR
ncbi:hypothetical protein [Bradyrhizobium sp. URHC0002]